jgi:predicted XRE-type DNA-binding protein
MKRDLAIIMGHTKVEGTCLVWTRCLNTDGYPRAVVDGNNNAKVHRIVWELTHDKNIPGGMCIRHSCDNPRCINPDHLLLGTIKENGQDKADRNRQPRVVTKELVFLVNQMARTLSTLRQKDIAHIVGIDARRVSDIVCGKYCSATGKFLGHG